MRVVAANIFEPRSDGGATTAPYLNVQGTFTVNGTPSAPVTMQGELGGTTVSWPGRGRTPGNRGRGSLRKATYRPNPARGPEGPRSRGQARLTEGDLSAEPALVLLIRIRNSARTCGQISVTQHFDAWAKAGMPLGKMDQVQILLEVGGGVGSAEFPIASVTVSNP